MAVGLDVEVFQEYASSGGSEAGALEGTAVISEALSSSWKNKSTRVIKKEYRLCLAFTDLRENNMESECEPGTAAPVSLGPLPVSVAMQAQSWSTAVRPHLLASPMDLGKLRELIEPPSQHGSGGDSPAMRPSSAAMRRAFVPHALHAQPCYRCIRRVPAVVQLLACGPGGQTCNQCSTQLAAPIWVLAGLMVLLVLDLFIFMFDFWMLAKSYFPAPLLLLILPPLAQPLAVILGPWFVLTEDATLGRLYASLTLFSFVNTLIVTVFLMVWSGLETWLFDAFVGICSLLIKVGLYWFSSAHVRNLEVAHDLSFSSANQARFVNKMVAPALGLSRNTSFRPRGTRLGDSSTGGSTLASRQVSGNLFHNSSRGGTNSSPNSRGTSGAEERQVLDAGRQSFASPATPRMGGEGRRGRQAEVASPY